MLVLDTVEPDPGGQEKAETPAAEPEDSTQAPAPDQPSSEDQAETRLSALRGLEGRRVRITNKDGKSRTGRLASVEDETVTLTVPMGGGSVDYYYELSEIDQFEAVSDP